MRNKIKTEELIRVDIDFKKELFDIKCKRIKFGKEFTNIPFGTRRFTKSIIRHQDWKRMKEDIINADLEDDRLK